MPASRSGWETMGVRTPTGQIFYCQAPVGVGPDDACPFQDDGRFPSGATGLAIVPSGSVWIGTSKAGLFHYKCSVDDPGLAENLADFLRYEQSYGRVPVLFGLDTIGGHACVADALAHTPPPCAIRPTDPKYFVHSTSRTAGDQIRQDGAIKSWYVLEQEGNPPSWHNLKSAVLGEPAEYPQYVNLGKVGSPWVEVVTASHQAGRFLGPDDSYEPGWRFYFDARGLIRAGMVTRVFGCKVHRVLPLKSYCLGQIDVSAVKITDSASWTSRRFTELADGAFIHGLSKPAD